MSYTDDFYGPYEDYLQEPRVRQVHDMAFAMLAGDPSFDRVLDLGCGLREFETYRNPPVVGYLGVDLHSPKQDIYQNYRDPSFLNSFAVLSFEPTAIVSLFSTELSGSEEDNWALYNSLFQAFPSVQAALVSGAYYRGREFEVYCPEVAGTVSYQTTKPLGYWERDEDVIEEKGRLVVPCPSEMFGPEEIEVWRVLQRKDD